ncbi:MAG TPA: hypothetical protein VMV92_39240 [Streptosporangiaceae bacterium]|nr:hypothetical protein [Streptosporangiaceae bacterium]
MSARERLRRRWFKVTGRACRVWWSILAAILGRVVMMTLTEALRSWRECRIGPLPRTRPAPGSGQEGRERYKAGRERVAFDVLDFIHENGGVDPWDMVEAIQSMCAGVFELSMDPAAWFGVQR